MSLEILVNNASTADSNYITWAPSACSISFQSPTPVATSLDIQIRSRHTATGGQIVFFDTIGGSESDVLSLSILQNGTPATFFVAGKFGFPSGSDKDVAIEIVEVQTGALLLSKEIMVRIRKNANQLSLPERDRFLAAIGTINSNNIFAEFRNMHLDSTSREAHGNMGFLPWHRAYILDLERELQKVDPSVALPYWRFDNPAPNIFTREFLGVPNQNGALQFTASNPLNFWTTDGMLGINRIPRFNTATASANVISEDDTINIGDIYSQFVSMENQPHGGAHVSFSGLIGAIHTAARDPLFFLLHNNVDRLWAKWQWVNDRFADTQTATYPFLGAAGSNPSTRIGHNLRDTMWPWNQVITTPRPDPAPGGNFPGLQFSIAPSSQPTVGDMIDYQGKINPNKRLGFDYDDVPFEL